MRIVEIRLEEDHGGVLELHPQITVVVGLTPDIRERLLDSVRRLCRGEVPPVGIVVAVHDLLVDATPSVLEVLGLVPGADPVVGAAGGAPRPHANGPRGGGQQAGAEEARQRLHAAGARVQGAEAARTEAEGAVRSAREELARIEGESADQWVDDVRRRHHEAEQALAWAREEAGPGPGEPELARLEEARSGHERALKRVEEAARIRAELHAEPGSSERFDSRPYDERIEELRRRADELDARLAELPTVDPDQLRQALADHDAAVDAVPAPATTTDEEAPAVVEARVELEDARRAMAEAEERAKPLTLDPDDVAELEGAHAELEEAEERAERALSGPLAKRKVKQAKQRLDVVLERLGLPSYGAFLIRSSGVNVDEEARHALQVARYRVQAAQAALGEAEERVIRDRARAELEAEQGARRRAEGTRADATHWLVQILVEAGGPVDESDPAGAARRFLDHLEESQRRQAGMAAERAGVNDTIAQVRRERAEAEQAAEEAQRHAGTAAGRARAQADHDLARAREELERAAATLERMGAELAEHREELDRMSERRRVVDDARHRLDEVQRELLEAESSQRSHRERLQAAAAALADAERRLDRARAIHAEAIRELEAAAGAAAGEPEVGEGPDHLPPDEGPEEMGPIGGEELEVHLLSRLAAQRTGGRAGSLPIVIDRVFDPVPADQRPPALRLLERMAPSVQVVVISDDDHVARWATDLGIERALVTRPGAAHAPTAAQT